MTNIVWKTMFYNSWVHFETFVEALTVKGSSEDFDNCIYNFFLPSTLQRMKKMKTRMNLQISSFLVLVSLYIHAVKRRASQIFFMYNRIAQMINDYHTHLLIWGLPYILAYKSDFWEWKIIWKLGFRLIGATYV